MSVIATTDTQHYEDIADKIREANNYAAFETELSNAKAQIAEDNSKFEDIDRNLQEINAKITPQFQLSEVNQYIMDFVNDPVVIISGGLDAYNRVISN